MNFKIKYLNVKPYETKALEKYLEKMALDGWLLSYSNFKILRFEKGKKLPLKYSIKRAEKASFWGGIDTAKAFTLKEQYENAGWILVPSFSKTKIFVTEDMLADVPSNKSFKEEIFTDISRSRKSIFIKLLIYSIVLIGLSIFTNNLNFFNHLGRIDILLFILLTLIILIFYNLLNLIKVSRFKTTFIQLLKENDNIQTLPNINSIKGKANFHTAMVIIFHLVLLIVFILPFVPSLVNMPTLALILFLIFFKLIRIELDYRSKVTGKDIGKYAIFIIILFVAMLSYLDSNYKLPRNSNAKITFKDFNITSTFQEYIAPINSLLSQSFCYLEYSENSRLLYEFVEVKYDFLIDRYYKDMVDSLLKTHYPLSPKELHGMPPNMKGYSYMSYSKDRLILNVKNKFIRIYKPEGISKEELIKVVYEKLK